MQRYKGLGRDGRGSAGRDHHGPRHRTLRRIRIEDAAAATEIFSLLMGTEVAPRRDFIVAGAAEARPGPASTPEPAGPGPLQARLSPVRQARRQPPRPPWRDDPRHARATGVTTEPRTAPPRTASWRRRAMPEPSRLPDRIRRSSTGTRRFGRAHRGAGPTQATTSMSSPLRNRWQRTPPVPRPFAGNSCSGVPSRCRPPPRQRRRAARHGDHHGGGVGPGGRDGVPAAAAASTAPNRHHRERRRTTSRAPAMPPAARPCGRTDGRREAAAAARPR